jgi:prevent-host-death family protein
MAKRVAVGEARAYLRDLVDDVRAKGERVKLTRYGKTLAFVVPVEDVRLLEECKDELVNCSERKRAARRRG